MHSSTSSNLRAVIGDNRAPDMAARVTAELDRDYAELDRNVEVLLERTRLLPEVIEDEATALRVGADIKELKDTDARVEAFRVAEKEPYLRAGNAVDAKFHALRDKIARRSRQGRPGMLDLLQGRVNAWLDRRRAQEEAERRARAQEEARRAAEAARREAEARKAADEAREREARSRKPEKAAAAAAAAEQAAALAAAEAAAAAERAEAARIATLARPADMVRTRGDNGVLLTQAREGFAILVDRMQITADGLARLLPYISDAELEKAARGYGRTTGYSQPLSGFEVGMRAKGVVR
jgi:hypothetical protein